MVEYAVTVKFNNKPDCVPSDYVNNVFSYWRSLGVVIVETAYEADSKGICHCHGIVEIPKRLFRKRLDMFGVHYKLLPLADRDGWRRYMFKGNKDELKVHIIAPQA